MPSDQTRKYGISESMIQALYYDIVGNKVIIRACINSFLFFTPIIIILNIKLSVEAIHAIMILKER